MGKDELRKALVREAEERIRNLWAEAERDIAELRGQVAAEQEEQERRLEQRLQEEMAVIRSEADQEAWQVAQRTRLEAEQRLGERLQALARKLLPELVAADRERWFCRLAGEIPAGDWCQVRLQGEDRPFAEKLFADAELIVDDGLAGGLIVTDRDERLRIDNSLGKRLERLWPRLLPELIRAVRKEVSAGAVAAFEEDS